MKAYYVKRVYGGVACQVEIMGSTPEGAVVLARSYGLPHIVHHSPTGFEFGYLGSGPADLALSILADYFDAPPELVLRRLRGPLDVDGTNARDNAEAVVRLYQSFKEDFIARQRGSEFSITADDIDRWLRDREASEGEDGE